MVTQRQLWRGTLTLLGFELGLAIAYLGRVVHQGQTPEWLDFNGLRSLPSLMQAGHLFTIGLLCLMLLWLRSRLARPYTVFLPLAIAVLCFYGGLDELTKLHLIWDQVSWKAIYLGVLAAIPIVGRHDLVWLWQQHRSIVGWVAVGLAVFLLGSFGGEMLKEAIATATENRSAHLAFVAEHVRITIEELAELMGETLILYAFATFTLTIWRGACTSQSKAASSRFKHEQ